MAEGVLIGAAKSVLPKIGDLALKEAIACWSARGDLEDLEETMELIEAVLLDAEERQNSDHAVKLWLRRLRKTLYEADDLFDKVLARDQSKKLLKLNKVRDFFSASNPVWLSWNMAGTIRSIRQKLDKIISDMERFSFKRYLPDGGLGSAPMSVAKLGRRDESSSHVVKEDIIGREVDQENIVKLLGDVGSTSVPNVIAIVGVGGLGKTTLAQLVYNDKFVTENFELKAWACVYDETNRREVIEGKILKSLYESVKPIDDPFFENILQEKYQDINKIQFEIEKFLKGKRFLLVLDDVWDDRRDEWDHFVGFLRKGKAGSKIVATMRSNSVAKAMGTRDSELYNLVELERENPLKLFKRGALRPEWEEDEDILKLLEEIFNKCPKLPLVLRSVASMLYLKVNVEEWEHVKHIIPTLSRVEERGNTNIMKVLKISYDHLPSHLKSCFAYCALFPKDHEFDQQVLVCLWMAQGFVQPPIGDESIEDVGNSYFIELLNKSFFLIEEKINEFGDVIKCHKMHDIMQDLAQYVSREEVSVISTNIRNQCFSKGVRHVMLDNRLADNILADNLPFRYAGQIRSIMMGETDNSLAKCAKLVSSSFTCLRALDLHKMKLRRVSSCVGELIHLRYLDLSRNRELSCLPNSITKLINLQTLNLSYCNEQLTRLPNDFSRLVNIRHLNLKVCRNLRCMPHGFGQLTSLQTLKGEFVVRKTRLSERLLGQSNSGLDALAGLCNLRKLYIKYIGWDKTDLEKLINSSDISDVERKLNKLTIDFLYGDPDEAKLVLDLFYRLRLGNLQILIILGYTVPRFPAWEQAVIPCLWNTLVKIYVGGSKCVILPPFSRLVHLKYLSVVYCSLLKYMEERSNGDGHADGSSRDRAESFFPSLVELYMRKLPSLEGWFAESTSLPSSLLSITTAPECPNLDCLESLTSLKKLHLSNCSKLRSLLGGILHADTLEELHIVGCELLFDSINETFTIKQNLQRLHLGGPANIESLSLWMPTHLTQQLRFLTITDFPKLISLGEVIPNLPSLEELEIYECVNLDLGEDEEEGNSPSTWQRLSDTAKSLHSLTLQSPSKLESLPKGIRHLTTLQKLSIGEFNNLTVVPAWIDHLTNLQTLEIVACPKLTTLPETLSNLRSLQSLLIRFCGDQIVEKCKETTGEYWPFIQHIRDRDIRIQ